MTLTCTVTSDSPSLSDTHLYCDLRQPQSLWHSPALWPRTTQSLWHSPVLWPQTALVSVTPTCTLASDNHNLCDTYLYSDLRQSQSLWHLPVLWPQTTPVSVTPNCTLASDNPSLCDTYLYSGLRQPKSLWQLFSHKSIWIVCFIKQSLQFIQLF